MVQYVEWESTSSLAKGARQHCVAYLPGDGGAATAATAATATAPKAVVCFHHGEQPAYAWCTVWATFMAPS